jgi:hypothetical protein
VSDQNKEPRSLLGCFANIALRCLFLFTFILLARVLGRSSFHLSQNESGMITFIVAGAFFLLLFCAGFRVVENEDHRGRRDRIALNVCALVLALGMFFMGAVIFTEKINSFGLSDGVIRVETDGPGPPESF